MVVDDLPIDFPAVIYCKILIAPVMAAKTPTNISNRAKPIPTVTLNAVIKGVFDAAAKAEIAGVSKST